MLSVTPSMPTCRCNGHQVAALKGDGPGLGLNEGGRCEAVPGQLLVVVVVVVGVLGEV